MKCIGMCTIILYWKVQWVTSREQNNILTLTFYTYDIEVIWNTRIMDSLSIYGIIMFSQCFILSFS